MNHFVTNLFRKIAKGSVVIVVVDISDLEATIPTPFIEHLASGNYEIFVVANKVDTLPTTISSEKVKGWLSSRLKLLLPGVELVEWV